MALSQLQQSTIEHLKLHVIEENELQSHCSLDHGKHDCTNTADARVGHLRTLPAEIQQHVLSVLDIKSLLTFRRVSKSAMNLVNSNMDHRKVVTNAPMALHIAIALGMHDKYTIASLFTALCRRTCADCGTPTYYLCLVNCQRICLSQNGFCQGETGPWRLIGQGSDGWLGYDENGTVTKFDTTASEMPLSFTPVLGFYMFSRRVGNVVVGRMFQIDPGDVYFRLRRSLKEEKWNLDDPHKAVYAVNSILHKSISVVVALWLSKNSSVGVYGSPCRICRVEDKVRDRRPVVGTPSWANYINFWQCEIWTQEGLVRHMREVHGCAEGDRSKR